MRPRVGMRRKGSQYLLKNLFPARSTDARTRRPQYWLKSLLSATF